MASNTVRWSRPAAWGQAGEGGGGGGRVPDPHRKTPAGVCCSNISIQMQIRNMHTCFLTKLCTHSYMSICLYVLRGGEVRGEGGGGGGGGSQSSLPALESLRAGQCKQLSQC